MTTTDALSFCIIGAGRISQVHGATLLNHPNAWVKYVVDPDQKSAGQLADKLKAEVATVEVAEQDSSLSGVLITSPTPTHADFMIRFVKAGKAVFCEKPIDLDLTRAQAVENTVSTYGTVCSVGFNRRFDPTFAELKRRLSAGEIGDLEQLIITSRDPTPPSMNYIKASGGIFRDMSIHDLDTARWILEEEPVTVSATGSCLIDSNIGRAGDLDSVMITLKTASGKLGQIINSRRSCYGYDQRIEAFGSKGLLQANNVSAHEVQLLGQEGLIKEKPLYFFMERYHAAFTAELNHFIECTLRQTTPSVTVTDGVRALALADACLEAYRTGQTILL